MDNGDWDRRPIGKDHPLDQGARYSSAKFPEIWTKASCIQFSGEFSNGCSSIRLRWSKQYPMRCKKIFTFNKIMIAFQLNMQKLFSCVCRFFTMYNNFLNPWNIQIYMKSNLNFSQVGKIYEIRLMMDFSGSNRGYCFIKFTQQRFAQVAIKKLDQYEIRPGRRIGVVASINNCRLHIYLMPSDMDLEKFVKVLFKWDNVNNHSTRFIPLNRKFTWWPTKYCKWRFINN